ncbi:PaaI family thioesterase [Oxalobacter sp. OttesenSCG-928-P03]|nr:PaaI family thioesterase [Oxalobacter sp. OttesenSCG-928-P03]
MRITENPFLNELGFELVSMADGMAEIAIRLQSHHMNSWQVMHGGIIMTLLDASMSRAARSLVEGVTSAATVEMKTSFFQPGGKAESRVRGTGRVLHRSTTMYYCEGEIWNGESLVAKAMGTFKVFRRSDIARRLKV